jgi:hypothetical protein
MNSSFPERKSHDAGAIRSWRGWSQANEQASTFTTASRHHRTDYISHQIGAEGD